MTDCPSCARASVNPRSGLFSVGCDDCAARSLAGGMEVFESAKAGQRTPAYRATLTRVFGSGAEDAGHARVKAWVSKIKAVPHA